MTFFPKMTEQPEHFILRSENIIRSDVSPGQLVPVNLAGLQAQGAMFQTAMNVSARRHAGEQLAIRPEDHAERPIETLVFVYLA